MILHKYRISGTVLKVKQRGRLIGYPTANILVAPLVKDGVYVSETLFRGKWYGSVTFIGRAVTFNEKDRYAETYLLNFSKTMYGQTISIRLIKKLRDIQRFSSVDDLIDQIKKDVINAEIILNKQIIALDK